MARPVALTGTPGTGKSSVAGLLEGRYRVVEVADLALAWGAARRSRGGTVVDLAKLSELLRRSDGRRSEVIVGHLAHLLPVRASIVLRCHPVELARRLRRSGRGDRADRQANFVSEATDLITLEARRSHRPVYEIDTTHRSVDRVARDVRRRLAALGPSRVGTVDWLADPAVTRLLLRGVR